MAKEESQTQPHIPIHQQRSSSVDKQEQQKEFEKRIKNLRIDMAITYGTPEGKRVLKWILDQCGFHKSCIGGNPGLGMDVAQGTIYNAGRESLYIEMRQLIPSETLKQVEYENINEVLE